MKPSEKQNLRPLQEQEIDDVHIFHKSVFPLIWRILILVFISVIINFLLALMAYLISPSSFQTVGSYVSINTAIFLVIELLFGTAMILLVLEWLSFLYIVSPKGLTVRKGILSYTEDLTRLVIVPNIKIEQGLFGRIFRYGDVRLVKAFGEKDILLFDVPDPDHVAEVIKKISLEAASRMGPMR